MDFEASVVQQGWEQVLAFIQKTFGKQPEDVASVLFLIGVQELGQGHRFFSKEEKQDLMHIATCRVLSSSGFYQLQGLDAEGWPLWNLVQSPPALNLKEQELFLKAHIIQYFQEEIL